MSCTEKDLIFLARIAKNTQSTQPASFEDDFGILIISWEQVEPIFCLFLSWPRSLHHQIPVAKVWITIKIGAKLFHYSKNVSPLECHDWLLTGLGYFCFCMKEDFSITPPSICQFSVCFRLSLLILIWWWIVSLKQMSVVHYLLIFTNIQMRGTTYMS